MRPLAQSCEPANNDRSSGGSAQERAAWIRGVALRIGFAMKRSASVAFMVSIADWWAGQFNTDGMFCSVPSCFC